MTAAFVPLDRVSTAWSGGRGHRSSEPSAQRRAGDKDKARNAGTSDAEEGAAEVPPARGARAALACVPAPSTHRRCTPTLSSA